MSAAEVMEGWRRVEVWLAANAPELARALRPGAAPERIEHAQRRLGFDWTEEARAWFRAHDGGGWPLAFIEAEFLSLEKSLFEREMMNDIDFGEDARGQPIGPVRGDWWNRRWVPIIGTGNMLCLDFDPAAGGRVGQVVEFMKGTDRRTVAFESVASMLASWADMLESGRYDYDDDRGELVEVGHH
jgi:cell wall assembly regulator SMI1